MYLLIPYQVDVPMRRLAWANGLLIGLTVVVFPLCFRKGEFSPFAEALALGEGRWGWVGHVFVHANLFHLLGNMLFLWVFGNAVCAKVGNLAYPMIYLGLG